MMWHSDKKPITDKDKRTVAFSNGDVLNSQSIKNSQSNLDVQVSAMGIKVSKGH